MRDLAQMEREELYAASVRRYRERERRKIRAAWYAHHCHMQDLHARLASEHERKALSLLEGGAP